MAARHMKLALLVEVMIYLMASRALIDQDWSYGQVIGLSLGAAILVRGLLVAATYIFSLVWQSEPPEALKIGVGTRLAAMAQEWLALLAMSIAIPFEARLMGPDRLRRPDDGRLPLLLVHGYLANRGFWYWVRNRLESAGWVVATLTLEPSYADIDDYADLIARRVETVLVATGSDQLTLIGHSMGGLAARAYLRKYGTSGVARLVTLASPHHGSRLTSFGWGLNAQQMHIGSEWLTALNTTKAGVLPTTISVFSYGDNLVMPQENARLEGVRNIAVPAVGHVGMAISPAFSNTLIEVLAL
jgi:triacylglycerol lipase